MRGELYWEWPDGVHVDRKMIKYRGVCLHKTFSAAVVIRASSSAPQRVRTSTQFLLTRNVKLADGSHEDGEIVRSLKVDINMYKITCAGVDFVL